MWFAYDSADGRTLEWLVPVDGSGDNSPFDGADGVLRIGSRRGVSAARTLVLARAQAAWVFPLDGDDVPDPDGLVELLDASAAEGQLGWLAANRLLLDGRRTVQWFEHASSWSPGELAGAWTAPFPFHPNTVLIRRQLALDAGGWPATGVNEDLALVLLVSERAPGAAVPTVPTRYYRTLGGPGDRGRRL